MSDDASEKPQVSTEKSGAPGNASEPEVAAAWPGDAPNPVSPAAAPVPGPPPFPAAAYGAVPPSVAPARRSVALSVATIVWAGVTFLLVLALVGVSVLLMLARGDVSDRDEVLGNNRHAEQVATDYAVGAATVDYKDFGSWIGRLKAGTAPELSNKFDATAPQLEQILKPLKWTSSAVPVAAKVDSEDDGVYVVDVFLNVTSTNAQSPDGAQTTVTYSVQVDSGSDWKVTDVGGMEAALPTK